MAKARWQMPAFLMMAALPAARAEEEEKADSVECAIAVMLLGSIGFQMLLFYLVNFPDADIQRYSWRVISQTISIFCAVLLFQGFNGIVEEYVIAGRGPVVEVVVDMLQLVLWLSALQLVLAVTSGAINELIGHGEPNMDKVELNVKSYSVLFAHLSAFASMNAWGSVQQNVLQQSSKTAIAVVPIGFFCLFAMFHGYHTMREHVALSDDGEKDEFEELWEEENKEAEHDVAGLSLSFLTVQSARFHISGVLPNQEGIEPFSMMRSHTLGQVEALFSVGACFFFGSLVPLLIENRLHGRLSRQSSETREWIERLVEVANNYFLFGSAWCFFFTVKWTLASTQFTDQAEMLGVVLALLLSAIAFVMIFALDFVMDHGLLGSSEVAETAAEKMILCLGFLIGFSWEQSFDTAVGVIATEIKDRIPPVVSKLLMSMLLVLIVFPAWRWYILKTERELDNNTATAEQLVLKTASEQHRELFHNTAVDEHALDVAHLRMKNHRRRAMGLPHPAGEHAAKLKHLRVTVGGILEVEEPLLGASPRKTSRHQQEVHENLLA